MKCSLVTIFLRYENVLPQNFSRRVVSVISDSDRYITFLTLQNYFLTRHYLSRETINLRLQSVITKSTISKINNIIILKLLCKIVNYCHAIEDLQIDLRYTS